MVFWKLLHLGRGEIGVVGQPKELAADIVAEHAQILGVVQHAVDENAVLEGTRPD